MARRGSRTSPSETGELYHSAAALALDDSVGKARSTPIPKPATPPWHASSTGAPGIINESHKGFLRHERAIAEYLAKQGNDVSSRATKQKVAGTGPQADALVNGVRTEFKRPGKRHNIVELLKRSAAKGGPNAMKGQAANVVIDVRGFKLDPIQVGKEIDAARRDLNNIIHYVRIIGDGGIDFTISDLSWP